MNKRQAEKIKEDLKAFSKKHGLWVEIKEERKPELKTILITVSVLINE